MENLDKSRNFTILFSRPEKGVELVNIMESIEKVIEFCYV